MYICFHHEIEYNAPPDIVLDADNDWTHFKYLHKKSHVLFKLIAKTEGYFVFLYRTRLLPYLPFFMEFIVFRELLPDKEGYRQVYLPVDGGMPNVLESVHTRNPDKGTITNTAKFYFWLKWYWRPFPGIFCNLLRRRMMKVWEEDFSMMRAKIKSKSVTQVACAPVVPESYRFDRDFLKNQTPFPAKVFTGKLYKDFYDEARTHKTKIHLQTQNV